MRSYTETIELNKIQAAYYDSIPEAESEQHAHGYAKNKRANYLTRAWAALRNRQSRALLRSGVYQSVKEAHARWVRRKLGGDFLEIGCFSGSCSTFSLIEAAGSYLGIDLSARAADRLRKKIADQDLSHKAKVMAGDFLSAEFDRPFDLVYTSGVLHHFENYEMLFAKLVEVVRPGGLLMLNEPSMVNPAYQMVRKLYRPFQSDAAWEWPFSLGTVRRLEESFVPLEGFGWGRWSLPISVVACLPIPGVSSCYASLVAKEVRQGLHEKIWSNSMVTMLCRLRSQAEPPSMRQGGPRSTSSCLMSRPGARSSMLRNESKPWPDPPPVGGCAADAEATPRRATSGSRR